MNADWKFDDEALDALIRDATETIEPPAGFAERTRHALQREMAAAEPVRLRSNWLAPTLAAAAVLVLLLIGLRVQMAMNVQPMPPRETAHTIETSGDRVPTTVRVTFDKDHDAIVVREPTIHPNVTILWIHPVASPDRASLDAPDPRDEPVQ